MSDDKTPPEFAWGLGRACTKCGEWVQARDEREAQNFASIDGFLCTECGVKGTPLEKHFRAYLAMKGTKGNRND